MINTGIKVGPLSVVKVQGSELTAGDIISVGKGLLVINRSYPLEHIRTQMCDVEDGFQDADGEWMSPRAMRFKMDEEYIIYRAVKE